MENRKYTFEDAVKKFDELGYILLSDSNEYTNVASKLRYLCPKHLDKGEMRISFGHINAGKGCYYCGREKTIKAHELDLSIFEDEDRSLCERNNFEYISTERLNLTGRNKIYIKFICNQHKDLGFQYMDRVNMKRDIKGCKFCSGKNLPKWYILNKIHQSNQDIIVVDDFDKLNDYVEYKCIKHGITSTTKVKMLVKGCCCVECGKEKLSKYKMLSIDEYRAMVSKKKDTIDVIDYNGMEHYSTFRCKKCNNIWQSNSAYMVQSKYGKQCPFCESYYYGEKRIEEILEKYGITNIQQYRFSDCKNIRPLPFDFYLPDYNICIEFDGQQHYYQRKGWTDLSIIQNNDNIKNEYCTSNNIPLIRIPFWESDNMEYFLCEKLRKFGVQLN